MSRKRRLLVRYTLLGVVAVGASLAAALTLLDREVEIPREGLVPGLSDALAEALPRDAPHFRFTPVALDFRHFDGVRSRRLPEDMGSGVAIEDLDGDGLADLVFVNATPLGAPPAPPVLYRNLGAFRFERVEARLPALLGMGVAAADYDADCDLDLYVTGYGRNVLLRNDGAFRFTDVTDEAQVAGAGFCAGACWGDADGDGDLDLYVCRYVEFDETMPVKASVRGNQGLPVTLNPSAFPAQENLLFLNDGGRFREAAKELGVSNPGGKSLGALFADFDGDGISDLYVANDVSDNAMFRGLGGGRYEDVTHASCTADWRGAMGLAVGDPDLDGDLDLFITHWITEENTLYVKEPGELLFRDDSERTYLGPPGRGRVGWACDFADFDRDGRPDLYVVNGSTFEEPAAPAYLVPQHLQLFWNGGRRFFDVALRTGGALASPVVGRGGTVGDLDGDGDIDWVVNVHGGSPLVLRNDSETANRGIEVVVRGSHPDPFGYGAVVSVTAGGRTQVQQVGAKVSYLSHGPHALHFGLGRAAGADRVTVRYPSGRVVTHEGVAAGSTLVVKEVDPRTLGPRMDRAADAGAAEAIPLYREVLGLDPFHTGALYNLALRVEPEEAILLCDRLLALEPKLPRGHLLKAALRSDPQRPEMLDLEVALRELANAQRLNRDETGARYEEGRIHLLRGDLRAAAATLSLARHNPRAAALGALCFHRLGDAEGARALLALHGGAPGPYIAGEGDTHKKKMDDRDLLARLLAFGPEERWEMQPLPLGAMDGAHCELRDADGDGRLDACCGDMVVSLKGRQVVGLRPGAGATPAPRTRFARYRFEEAARWALRPPELCDGPPPGATATCEADADGDGDLDLFVACGADDPAAPLPWWLLLREGERFRPVRGSVPEPGFRVAALDAKDLDGDGRAEVLLKGGGFLPGDAGRTYLAWLR